MNIPSFLSDLTTLAISQCILKFNYKINYHFTFFSTNVSKNAAAVDAGTLPSPEFTISVTYPNTYPLCSAFKGNGQKSSLENYCAFFNNFNDYYLFVNTPHILPKAVFIVPVSVDNSIISAILKLS